MFTKHKKSTSQLSFAIASSLSLVLAGCGAASEISGSPASVKPTQFVAGNTQLWLSQLQNQTLLPACPTSTSCSPTNQVNSVSTDSKGNFMIGGSALTELPGITNISVNTSSIVVKYSGTGDLLWTQQFGPSTSVGFTNLFSIAVDSQGNTYAGGIITGAFAGYANPSAQEQLMLVKLDPSGHILFTQQYASDLHLLNAEGGSISLLSSGEIAYGWYSSGTTTDSGDQSFLVIVDPTTGTKKFERSYPGANQMLKITSDAANNIYAIGVSLGSFPGTPNISGSPSSPTLPFVLKLDADTGNVVWSQSLSDYLTAQHLSALLFSLSLDPLGNLLVGGSVTNAGGELCSGQCNLQSVQNQGGLLAKVNGQNGDVLWTQTISSGAGDGITGVTTDGAGNSFGVGFTNGILANGFSQPTQDFFAIKLGANGNPIWLQQFGAGPWKYLLPPTSGIQAAADATGNLFVSGVTQGALPGISNPTSLGEAFVIKFGP